MPDGLPSLVGSRNSLMTPAGVMRATPWREKRVTHMLPSGPATISSGVEPWASWYVVAAP